MPKIFNEAEKEMIRKKLLACGMRYLEKKGYKNSQIEEIAKSAGIAKGTFYHFFLSKERFFYEIILSIRDKNREELHQLVYGGAELDRKSLAAYFFKRYTVNKTVYHYFSVEELNVIFRKLPDLADITTAESNEFAAEIFSGLASVNPDFKIEVVVNMMNVLAAFSANRDVLASAYYEETVRLMADALADYIFKK